MPGLALAPALEVTKKLSKVLLLEESIEYLHQWCLAFCIDFPPRFAFTCVVILSSVSCSLAGRAVSCWGTRLTHFCNFFKFTQLGFCLLLSGIMLKMIHVDHPT